MNLKTMLALLVIVGSGMGLAGCGGGSASGGASSRSAEPNLIVKVSGNNTAYFQSGPESGIHMAAAISNFLISEAMAQAGYLRG